MKGNRARANLLTKVLSVLVVFCATAAVAVVVAADCKVFDMQSPDPESLKLKDGEHVIASVATRGGTVEARVVVKGKDISDNQLYMGGKLMRTTPEGRVPSDLRECLGLKRTALPSVTGWLSSAAGALRDLVEAPVEAKSPRCTYKCACNQNTCCCLANCGGSTGVGCAGY